MGSGWVRMESESLWEWVESEGRRNGRVNGSWVTQDIPPGGPVVCERLCGTRHCAAGEQWLGMKAAKWACPSQGRSSERRMVTGRTGRGWNGTSKCGVLGSSVWGRLPKAAAAMVGGSPWAGPSSAWPVWCLPCPSRGSSPVNMNKHNRSGFNLRVGCGWNSKCNHLNQAVFLKRSRKLENRKN